MVTAGRLISMELDRAITGQHGSPPLTVDELGFIVARRLDRAGLITRSE